MNDSYDVIVIGAGPAGYHAAIKCAQLGLSTACIDKAVDQSGSPAYGGTCLNWGCIPSKTLLDASHKFEEAKNNFGQIGIQHTGLEVDLSAMMAHKDSVVKSLTMGVAGLFKGNGVTDLPGHGKLLADCAVEYKPSDGGEAELLVAEHIILAPGSVPIEIQAAPLGKDLIVDSKGALEFDAVPSRLGIIGAGVIGLELGSVWSRLGSEVVLLEALETFLPMADERIAQDSLKIFRGQGLDIRLGSKVVSATIESSGVLVEYEDQNGSQALEVDKLVVAVGRRPYIDNLYSPESGVSSDERGFIVVNDQCLTGAKNVYAVGDAVRGPMLAHKGMEEGIMVAEAIAGSKPDIAYDRVPSVIYTNPEVAWVGLTEQEASNLGVEYSVGTFPFAASGRALAANESQGMVKILTNADTDQVLGVHVLGAHGSELIAQAVIAMEFEASAEDLALTMFAHPTLGEAVHEAALSVAGKAIHMVNRKPSKRK